MAREVEVPSAEPSNASPELAPLPMRPWERAASFLFGLGFGGAGVYAIFTTTNQVGSAALVIAGAAFSLIAVQGTRLIRLGSGSASVELDRVRQAAKIITEARAFG